MAQPGAARDALRQHGRPQGVGGVKIYPSRLSVGRDGRLHAVRVGWAGPATGAFDVMTKRDFEATVQRLVRERV